MTLVYQTGSFSESVNTDFFNLYQFERSGNVVGFSVFLPFFNWDFSEENVTWLQNTLGSHLSEVPKPRF